MHIAAKIGIGVVGAAAVGGAGFLIYQGARNRSEPLDGLSDKYISKFDTNADRAISIEYEARRMETFSNSTYVDNGTGGGYYVHDSGTRIESMTPLAQRADAKAPTGTGNGDGKASFQELVAVMSKYDTGDGARHAAGDAILGGQELRNFNKAYGIKTTTAG